MFQDALSVIITAKPRVTEVTTVTKGRGWDAGSNAGVEFPAREVVMRKALIVLIALMAVEVRAQVKLSTHWEELTAADFREAIHQSSGTCLLPFGILEKHGPHLPLGTDLLDVRY